MRTERWLMGLAALSERRALAACIAKTRQMRQPATRALVLALRRG